MGKSSVAEVVKPIEFLARRQKSQEPFKTLDDLIGAIQKLQEPDFDIDEKFAGISDETLLKIYTRTKNILLAAVEYDPHVDDEGLINSMDSQDILRYGYLVSRECFKSKGEDAELLGRYLAGYDVELIACIHNMSSKSVVQKMHGNMFEPQVLADILAVGEHQKTAKNTGRAALRLVTPGSPFDDIVSNDLCPTGIFIPPQHDDV